MFVFTKNKHILLPQQRHSAAKNWKRSVICEVFFAVHNGFRRIREIEGNLFVRGGRVLPAATALSEHMQMGHRGSLMGVVGVRRAAYL
jgi:hypothetical protein